MSSEDSSLDSSRVVKHLDVRKKKEQPWWMNEVEEEDNDHGNLLAFFFFLLSLSLLLFKVKDRVAYFFR